MPKQRSRFSHGLGCRPSYPRWQRRSTEHKRQQFVDRVIIAVGDQTTPNTTAYRVYMSRHRHGCSQDHKKPPTRATSDFVARLTRRSAPRHAWACARKLSTSAPRRRRRSGEAVASINDSSVSRFADREFKLVDPNNVRQGSAAELGRTQIPSMRA